MWLSDSLPEASEPLRIGRAPSEARPRAAGSPLAMGNRTSSRPVRPEPVSERRQARPETVLERTLPKPEPKQEKQPSGIERAASMLRMAIPFVQRFLPLIDGPLGAVVSGVLAPRPKESHPAQASNLVPLEKGLIRLENQHQELCEQVAAQNSSLQRVEDRLQSLREATDRNTLEQQELMEDLKSVGTKVNMITFIVIAMLLASLLLNLVLYLHMERVLP